MLPQSSLTNSEKPASATRCCGRITSQHARLVEIRDNLIARIAEAEREGWLGEVEGLQVSLAGAGDKLAQLDAERPARAPYRPRHAHFRLAREPGQYGHCPPRSP
jgi:hypothetical protein